MVFAGDGGDCGDGGNFPQAWFEHDYVTDDAVQVTYHMKAGRIC